MIRTILLALLLTSLAHAEGWCTGILTSNNVCESNVPTGSFAAITTIATAIRGVLASVINVLLSIGERRNRHRRADHRPHLYSSITT